MNVLGISGIEGAIPFKKKHWPGREEREYRISQGHDSAAALVIDGAVVAAVAEERLSRRKHTGDFPSRAIGYCLEAAGLAPGDVDAIAHGFDYAPYRTAFSADPLSDALYREVYSRDAQAALLARDCPEIAPARLQAVPHHLAHAASAYFTSGWDECLVVVIDAMGEAHSVTAYRAAAGRLEKIHQISAQDSIGVLYSLVTLHLGFDFNADEYKIMGLAPYGDAERYRAFFDAAVVPGGGGGPAGIRIPPLRLNRTREAREFYLATRDLLARDLIPARQPDAAVTDAHRDVAASLQACLDRVILQLCTSYANETGLRRLAMAGGVALNCTANGRLLRAGVFDEIYVQPAAGDDGTALGAALHVAAQAGEVRNRRMGTPFLGPAHGGPEIDAALAAAADRVSITRHQGLRESAAAAAELIAAGKVIAWYRGRMEFGPRALGHRSILANPGHPEMRDRINAMVKMREAFRPFAPAVTLEEVDRWFDVPAGTELPFMIMTVPVREPHRAALPAVTHVDGSARVQTVAADDNPEFHTLLRAVGERTGRQLVLNTSFNVKGQPIVDSPQEALDTFLGTGIEYLFLDDVQVSRRASGKTTG